MSTWERFIDQMARNEDPSEDFIRSRLSDDILRGWFDRESEMLTPAQLISDVLDEMQQHEAALSLETLKASNPQYVTWRLLRDAARRCAIRDAGREIHAAQLAESERNGYCDDDTLTRDRRALAREHNRMVLR